MIVEAELRRLAFRWQVDPMILDLDYTLGWFLAGLASTSDLSQRLLFKGGTCLRKCYFPGYRFSEDLDFTAVTFLDKDALTGWIEQVLHWSDKQDGPNFTAQPYRLEVVEDEYGKESYQVRVYYRGPLIWGGSPRAIRMDVTRDERVFFPAVQHSLLHPYSDRQTLENVQIACYSLDEMLAEKIRAVSAQRRFAISRDLYDIYQLINSGVQVSDVMHVLPAKFAARGLDITTLDFSSFIHRRAEFEMDWQNRLSYLVPGSQPISFTDAWQTIISVMQQVRSFLSNQDSL